MSTHNAVCLNVKVLHLLSHSHGMRCMCINCVPRHRGGDELSMWCINSYNTSTRVLHGTRITKTRMFRMTAVSKSTQQVLIVLSCDVHVHVMEDCSFRANQCSVRFIGRAGTQENPDQQVTLAPCEVPAAVCTIRNLHMQSYPRGRGSRLFYDDTHAHSR